MANKIVVTKMKLLNRFNNTLLKKREGFDGVVVVIGLCLIVIIVLVLFRSQMTESIKTLISDLVGKLKGLGAALTT